MEKRLWVRDGCSTQGQKGRSLRPSVHRTSGMASVSGSRERVPSLVFMGYIPRSCAIAQNRSIDFAGELTTLHKLPLCPYETWCLLKHILAPDRLCGPRGEARNETSLFFSDSNFKFQESPVGPKWLPSGQRGRKEKKTWACNQPDNLDPRRSNQLL